MNNLNIDKFLRRNKPLKLTQEEIEYTNSPKSMKVIKFALI